MIKMIDRLNKEYIKVEDACIMLNYSRMTLYRKEKQGLIKSIRYGRYKYYKINDIDSYISSSLNATISSS